MMHALAPWLLALVAASLKGSVILIAALLALRGMRRASAEARHAVLAIGLIAFLVLPAVTLLAPVWTVIPLPVDVATAIDRARGDERIVGGLTPRPADERRSSGAAAPSGAASSDANTASAAQPVSPVDGTTGGERPASASDRPPSAAIGIPALGGAAVLALGWFLGATLVGLRLLIGIARLRFLSRRATMVTDGAWLHTAHAIARRLGLTRGVTLLRGDREAVPMTWGVLSPVVWLPPAADAWPAEVRRSVLAHELAHVRRRDAVTQWVANVATALHWFNPLVWIATSALRAERERACDDAVLALGAAPDDYAAHLLDMVRALGARGGPAPAMAMARRSQFEGRLLAILDRACSRAPVGTGRLGLAGLGAAVLVLALGGLRTGEAARAEGSDESLMRIPVSSSVLAQPQRAEGRPSVARAANAGRGDGAMVLTSRTRPLGQAGDANTPAPSVPVAHADAAGALTMRSPSAPPSFPELPTTLPATSAPSASVPPPVAPADAAVRQGAAFTRKDTALLLDVISAAEGISSSSDRIAVLERVAAVRDLAPTVVSALGRAAGRVPSSTSRAKLLRTVIRQQPHAVGESRRAVLDALSSELSSTDFSVVIEEFVRRDGVTEAALADAFTATMKMSSNTEKSRVLVVAARLHKPDGAARAAYLKAASTITTGSDRARVLSALFEDPPGAGAAR